LALRVGRFRSEERLPPTRSKFSGWCTAEEDENADGTVDFIRTNTYDSDGNLIKTEEDYGADGTFDIIYTYTYDSQGNPCAG
jgi:hypothetical protein